MNVFNDCPVMGYHSRMVLSKDADAKILPSGENIIEFIAFVWPVSVIKSVLYCGVP